MIYDFICHNIICHKIVSRKPPRRDPMRALLHSLPLAPAKVSMHMRVPQRQISWFLLFPSPDQKLLRCVETFPAAPSGFRRRAGWFIATSSPRSSYEMLWFGLETIEFFPTCQVRVVRFYVSCLLLSSPPHLLLISSSSPPPPPRRPPPRPPRPPRPTATRDPQCSLSDLNHDHPCSVEVRQGTLGGDGRGWGPAGNTGRGWSWWGPAGNTWRGYSRCSLPDLNHDHPRPVFPAGPQPRVSTPSVPCRTSCRKIWDKECAEES